MTLSPNDKVWRFEIVGFDKDKGRNGRFFGICFAPSEDEARNLIHVPSGRTVHIFEHPSPKDSRQLFLAGGVYT